MFSVEESAIKFLVLPAKEANRIRQDEGIKLLTALGKHSSDFIASTGKA